MRFTFKFFAAVALAWSLSACSPIRFTCGVGEFGPRAKLAAYGVSPEDVEVLAHLCGGSVDERS